MSDYHSQSMTAAANVYTLPRCSVSLWTGDTTLVESAWTAEQVDDLKVRETAVEYEYWPTGAPYPETRHRNIGHEIEFDAIWNVAAALAQNVEYILAITWQNATLSGTGTSWVRRFYHGVTTSAREISSRDGNEFGSSNTLKAQYFTETTSASAPAILQYGLAA